MSKEKDKKHYIDSFVGKVIRNRRREINLKLRDLAQLIGITQQQVQKYEKGSNRISASKLYEVANALGREINYFFPNVDDYKMQQETHSTSLSDSPREEYTVEMKENVLRLLRSFKQIDSIKVQEQILLLVETLSREHNSDKEK